MDIKNQITELLLSTNRAKMQQMIDFLECNNFFICPASTKYHNAFDGGLAAHSFGVYELYNRMSKKYQLNIPDETIIICSFLHDVCKCMQYVKEGNEWVWNPIASNKHAEYSIKIITEFIVLTEQEQQIIKYHMGMYGVDKEYKLSELIKAFNSKDAKLFYFCDEISANFMEKAK